MKIIELTQDQVAWVDDEDFEWLSQWKWFAHWEQKTQSFYACRTVQATETTKQGTVWMHRQILGLVVNDGKIGDHIDTAATLDNRRNNLRVVNAHQSVCNRRAQRNNKLGIKGVSLNNGSYLVRIMVNRKTICLGRRKNLDDAKALYAEGAKKYHGEFARF